MKKWIKAVLAAVIVWSRRRAAVAMTPPPPQPPVLPPPPATRAVSAAVIDGNTGEIYADKDGEARINPASTTKILTCILPWRRGTVCSMRMR